MDVCIIDEDFTIDVVEDPEQSCDDEYLKNLLEEETKKSTNQPSEEEQSNKIFKAVFEKAAVNGTDKVEPEAEKISENNKEEPDKKPKSKKFQCEACGYYTTVHTAYYLHLQAHLDPSNKLYKCKKCNFATFFKGALSQHMNRHVPKEKLVRCPHCEFATAKHKNLTVHLKSMHENGKKRQYKCLRCSFVTENKEDLEKHKSEVHNTKFRCKVCKFWPSTQEEKDEHMKEHRHERKLKNYKIHKCDCCNYESKFLSNVVKHRTKHVEDMIKE